MKFQRLKQLARIFGYQLENNFVAGHFFSNNKTFFNIGSTAAQQQSRSFLNTLIHVANSYLLQIHIVNPDQLAIRNNQLLKRCICLPAHFSGLGDGQTATHLLQNASGCIAGGLHKRGFKTLQLFQAQ